MELNGAPATIDQIKSLALTNYGHFTSMLVEDQQVRGLSLHMQRLARDCRQLYGVELETDRVRQYIRHALADTTQPTVVRVTIYDPELGLGTIGSDASPAVLVTTRPTPHGSPSPLRLQAVSYRREDPAVKHVGLFGPLRHRRSAQREGFDDVLFLNPDGTISEIATSNIGFVRDGQVVWPRSEYLSGVTMTLLNQALDEPVKAEPLTLAELADTEAAFATNAATGIRPVTSVDGVQWPEDHKVLRELRDLYTDIPAEHL
ncbi:aminotransferase class IV family protein [Haloactinomyces albus]|uniref:Branched-subunit amino acid aminotransferase/4-amino-4-deoxychorismate lyase n=1 Tax=Haloactinomyces albus TaxID=1352928 RepID=A0AAE3ZGX9_9ACTN|nr:aminotransferase class IV family protein [Haloactinomyces albus]MDR7301823.1 branched-subunit amino acid aminotransferase/4-amino-4-deoxychorismate lyase [Haloactinomyces albus]MDR7304728.1 branched-subunit amino acid aminotransferase/4-amino-4-deoxychorismate lyase [Haloactinomyces albus]